MLPIGDDEGSAQGARIVTIALLLIGMTLVVDTAWWFAAGHFLRATRRRPGG